MSTLAKLIATGGYIGYAPVASGTFGTLPGVALAFLFSGLAPGAYAAVLIVSIAIAIWASDRYAAEIGTKDPSSVVADEIVGYLAAVAFLPSFDAGVAVLAFLVFRFFDIVKPPPARQAERLPGGVGIVIDDVVAGIYANIVVRVVVAVWG